MKRTELSVEWLERMAQVLRVLAHPHRIKVIELLEARRTAPVYEISEHVGLPQAAMSHHLGQMKRAGIVRSVRRGKEVWYAIAEPRALTILGCMRKKKARSA